MPRTKKIGGRAITAMQPSQPLPPLRLEREPRTDEERTKLLIRCQQIVFRLQGARLTWAEVQQRALTIMHDALAEAGRQVREPAALAQHRIVQPPGDETLKRSPGGILLPRG